MGTRVVKFCDLCESEYELPSGGVFRLTSNDARKTSKTGDICDKCLHAHPGKTVARRGRKPKPALTA